MKIKKVLHNLKNLINRLFGFKDKKINKPKLTLVVNKTDNQEGKSENAYFSYYEEHFTFEEDISEEYRSELKNHLKESLEQKVHPWDFEKNLDFKLKEPDQIYYLFMYCLMYVDIYEQDLLNKFTKLWYENNLDDTTKSDEEINNEALRLFKYEVLGFNLIICLHISLPMDPPAPVTNTFFPFIFFFSNSIFGSTGSLPKISSTFAL